VHLHQKRTSLGIDDAEAGGDALVSVVPLGGSELPHLVEWMSFALALLPVARITWHALKEGCRGAQRGRWIVTPVLTGAGRDKEHVPLAPARANALAADAVSRVLISGAVTLSGQAVGSRPGLLRRLLMRPTNSA
jgi:hypothetical protein